MSATRTGSAEDPLRLLAAAAVRGDERAACRLVEALGPSLLWVARRVLGGNHPDLEDLLQEGALHVLRALPGFRGDCTVAHFACAIVFRRVLDAKRRRHKTESLLDDYRRQTAIEESSDEGGPEQARRRALLAALMTELPHAQAETIGLRYFAGMTIEEVGAATGTPANTVRSRLRLAKEALRRAIEEDQRFAGLRGGVMG